LIRQPTSTRNKSPAFLWYGTPALTSHFVSIIIIIIIIVIIIIIIDLLCPLQEKSKVKDYFIVRPKVDQRAGLLSLPHLGIFAIHTRIF